MERQKAGWIRISNIKSNSVSFILKMKIEGKYITAKQLNFSPSFRYVIQILVGKCGDICYYLADFPIALVKLSQLFLLPF